MKMKKTRLLLLLVLLSRTVSAEQTLTDTEQTLLNEIAQDSAQVRQLLKDTNELEQSSQAFKAEMLQIKKQKIRAQKLYFLILSRIANINKILNNWDISSCERITVYQQAILEQEKIKAEVNRLVCPSEFCSRELKQVDKRINSIKSALKGHEKICASQVTSYSKKRGIKNEM